MKRIAIFFITLVLVGCSGVSTITKNIDNRLVGDWYGERNIETTCQYVSWETNRDDNGNYTIHFYSDPERKKLIQSESGKWWTTGSKFYEQVPGIMKQPYEYSFEVKTKNEIHFELVSADELGDCVSDYSFADFRIYK